jgi:hypothetical protein
MRMMLEAGDGASETSLAGLQHQRRSGDEGSGWTYPVVLVMASASRWPGLMLSMVVKTTCGAARAHLFERVKVYPQFSSHLEEEHDCIPAVFSLYSLGVG